MEKQKQTQTETIITILRSPIGGELIIRGQCKANKKLWRCTAGEIGIDGMPLRAMFIQLGPTKYNVVD